MDLSKISDLNLSTLHDQAVGGKNAAFALMDSESGAEVDMWYSVACAVAKVYQVEILRRSLQTGR